MGSVSSYETAKGRRYRGRWRDVTGAQHEKRGFLTKREAKLHVATVEVSIFRGTYSSPSEARITVGELAVGWLANKEEALKPSSFAPLRTAWRVYVAPRWATTPIGAIRPSAVEQWIRELGRGEAVTARIRPSHAGKPRSHSVVFRGVGILAGILDVAVRDGRITSNPARGATNLPRNEWKQRRRYLTNDEVFRFARSAPDRMRSALILTLAYTGIRWGEAVALTVNDVDLARRRLDIYRTATEVEGVIHVGAPKSWQARSVPFPAFLNSHLAALSANKNPAELIFAAAGSEFLSRPATAKGGQSWWLTALRNAELEHFTPHALKHTAASLAVSAGANVKALQRMLGHKSAAMTLDTYADLFEDDLTAVADRLNERVLTEGLGEL